MVNVMGYYKGVCGYWDVVNEVINDDGIWCDSVFYWVFGIDYLFFFFELVKKYDFEIKL